MPEKHGLHCSPQCNSHNPPSNIYLLLYPAKDQGSGMQALIEVHRRVHFLGQKVNMAVS